MENLCIGRIAKANANDRGHFGHTTRRFYFEYRCNRRVAPNALCCDRCNNRSVDGKIQSSGFYNHGLITESIPPDSQMYGGSEYEKLYILHGKPSDEDIAKAEICKAAARKGLNIVEVPKEVPVKVADKAVVPKVQKQTKLQFKRTAIAAATDAAATDAAATADIVVTPIATATKPIIMSAPIAPIAKKPAPKPRAKSAVTSKPVIQVEEKPKNIVATHIERDVEEFYADEYEIEHVRLSPFEHNSVRYFREPKKNKLFQQINGSLGDYIGRYDAYTDSIQTDIPDSDEE
jgi:hypothetical protein